MEGTIPGRGDTGVSSQRELELPSTPSLGPKALACDASVSFKALTRPDRTEDDDHHQSYRDQRGPRRRHEPPVPSRLRKQIIDLADSPLRRVQEEVNGVAHLLADNYDDERLRANFVDLILQLAVEQPLKTPFAAAAVLVVNTLTHKPAPAAAPTASNGGDDGLDTSMENGGQDASKEPQPTSGVVDDLLTKAAAQVEEKVRLGEWRAVKLYLKLLACLQSCLEGDGVFPILEDLFNQAVELQTNNNEDVSCTGATYDLYKDVRTDLLISISSVDHWYRAGQDNPSHDTLRRCCSTRQDGEACYGASGQDRGHRRGAAYPPEPD